MKVVFLMFLLVTSGCVTGYPAIDSKLLKLSEIRNENRK